MGSCGCPNTPIFRAAGSPLNRAGGPLPKEYLHTSGPFSSLAAAVTERILLGTGVSLIIEHNTLSQAKKAATLARISNGRFLFGVGADRVWEETQNYDPPPNRCWQVFKEYIEAMRALWTHEEASSHDEVVNFDRVWSYPKPLTVPHPPIILGSMISQLGWKRVVDHCASWLPIETLIDN